jgi:hypothetical protein
MLKRFGISTALILALVMLCIAGVLLVPGAAQAQTTTPTPVPTTAPAATTAPTTNTTQSQSSVNILGVVCDTRAVLNFNGFMEAGYDLYYQVFSAAGATGTPLTSLRQLSVDGNYSVSEVATYDNAATVAAGTTGSIRVLIAREGNSASSTVDTTVNDLQDGCSEPQFATGASTDAGSGTTSSTVATGPQIRSPFGGFLNPGYTPTQAAPVVIGARNVLPPRQQTPGLIFAECDQFPLANPGLIYDTDVITVFWSWFARTPEQVQDHIDNAIYEVGLFDSEPFVQPVIVSDIEQRGTNYWVFYTITVGRMQPANYPIEFKLSWENPITDGYDEFGPGTANERFNSTCTFTVRPNLAGADVKYDFP